ncbi:MAG: polysaccharide deacetylase family protein [Cellulosilyticaceae bacterium]
MGYNNKSKKNIGITICIVLLSVSLLATTGWIGMKNSDREKTLKNIEKEADILTESKAVLDTSIENLKEKNSQLTQQIEELTLEIDDLKNKGYELEALEEGYEDKKYAYLTFDDGPSQNTIKILDFLKVNNIQATFFVLGKTGYDDVYKRIVEEGHTLALHSDTHDYSSIYRTVDTFMGDIQSLSNQMKDLTGVESKVLRFPGGSNNTVSRKYGGANIMDNIINSVVEAGYAYFDWNVDSQDASKGVQEKQVIIDSVLNQSKYNPNPVILMHDAAAKTTTVEALPDIVEGLKAQGFVFRPLTTESEPVRFK